MIKKNKRTFLRKFKIEQKSLMSFKDFIFTVKKEVTIRLKWLDFLIEMEKVL
jgi:hypothetical protein